MLENRIINIIYSTSDYCGDAARTHLNNHVTMEEEILTLDKNCEYCQIYLI